MDSANALTDCVAMLQLSGHVDPHALNKIGVPLYVADRGGVFLWVNASAKALHGDIVGRPIGTVVAPEELGFALRQFDLKITGQAVATDFHLTLLDSTGKRVAARIHSVSLASDGSDAAVFGLAIPGSAKPDTGSADDQPVAVQLTGRQHETLLLLGDGFGTSEIAAQLGISVDTARNHIRAVMNALGAHSRLESVAIAHRIGLLPPRR